jgi:hypothetical protein
MTKIVVDDTLRAKLGDFKERLELCDAAGRKLAVVLPAADDDGLVRPSDRCPYTREELEQFRQENGGRTLAEIWKRLGQE